MESTTTTPAEAARLATAGPARRKRRAGGERETRRSIVYARVSTDEQAGSGLGIESQAERCRAYAVAHGYLPVDEARDEGVSGAVAPDDRPGLGAALAALDCGMADVLIATEISRLGRRAADVLDLARRAEEAGWHLAILDLGIDTTTPAGKFALTVMAAVAELERGQTAERTRHALAAAKQRGQRLGAPVSGETRAAGRRAADLRSEGHTWQQVADRLHAEGYSTAKGGRWHPATAQRAVRSIELDAEATAAAAGAG